MSRHSYRSPVFSAAKTWHVSPCVLGKAQILSALSRVTILFSCFSVLGQVHSCCDHLELIFADFCLCVICGQLKCQVCKGWYMWPLWLSIGKEWRCWWLTSRSQKMSSPTDIPRSSSGTQERYRSDEAEISFPAHLDVSVFRRTVFSQRNVCNKGWAAHGAPPSPFPLQQLTCNQRSKNTWFHLTV